MPSSIEVLVVSHDSASEIDRLLRSLSDLLPDAQVAIREHAGAAAFAALVRVADDHPGVIRVEHDPINPGFGAGCNALAAGSGADVLVLLNPDTELVAWPWTDASPPPIGTIVGANIVGARSSDHYGTTYRIRDEIARSWLRRTPAVPEGDGFVSGAALLIDRRTFESLGGFDERYFLFYEDIDLCLRANAAGVPTVVEPRWHVRHARAHSTRRRFAAALASSYESGVRFHQSFGRSVAGYRAYVAADALMRAVVHTVRRDRTTTTAYLQLIRRALGDLARPGRRERSSTPP